MKAAGIDRFGAAVRAMTLADPRPLVPDEVLIRVMAAGVGNWDEFARVGDWISGAGRRWRWESKQLAWSSRPAHGAIDGPG